MFFVSLVTRPRLSYVQAVEPEASVSICESAIESVKSKTRRGRWDPVRSSGQAAAGWELALECYSLSFRFLFMDRIVLPCQYLFQRPQPNLTGKFRYQSSQH